MRLFFCLCLCLLLAGCGSAAKRKQASRQAQHRSTRGVERDRMEEIERPDTTREFALGAANFGGPKTVHTNAARTKEFQYQNRTQTKEFRTAGYTTKGSWLGNFRYETKAAEIKTAPEAKKSARTRTFATRESPDANREARTRALPEGNRPFLVQGRRQAEFDTKGPASQAPTQSWEGDLKPLTVEDVKKLLNKN